MIILKYQGTTGKHTLPEQSDALEQSHTCSLPQALKQAQPVKRGSARPMQDSSLHMAAMEDLKSQLAGANQQDASWHHGLTMSKWSTHSTAQCENADGKSSQWAFRDGACPRWQEQLKYTEKAGNHNQCLTHTTGDHSQETNAWWMLLCKKLVLTVSLCSDWTAQCCARFLPGYHWMKISYSFLLMLYLEKLISAPLVNKSLCLVQIQVS